ncbi:hypothetical protein DERF_006616 [Dermatophagoides farinae]|uniref:Uncharacterized protein n=1 Tax=Dermatophagoides farinae TaxID=6954 RepID=A0A922HYS9_DERFA|nr:hypothetical protein DERF_006616 [Dermatophagoides farinae]
MEMNETNLCTHVQFIIIIAVVFLNTPLALDLDNINNQTKMSMVNFISDSVIAIIQNYANQGVVSSLDFVVVVVVVVFIRTLNSPHLHRFPLCKKIVHFFLASKHL